LSEVVFVGTSDAFGAGGRRQSAVLVRAAGGSVLLDCGATTATGLCDLGIDREEIDAIVISHFHGDHYGGIPALLLAALYEDERKHPLRIVGPTGIEQRVRGLAAALGYDVEDREWTFPIVFETFDTAKMLECGPVRVGAFEAKHQQSTCPHGLIVEGGDVRVAYSGDTGWFDALPQHVNGSDLFICECTYHREGFELHLSYEGLTTRKEQFDCGRMILTHFGAEMSDRRGQGDFETADDGLVVHL